MYTILLLELNSMATTQKQYVIKRKKEAIKYIEDNFKDFDLIKIQRHFEQRTPKQNRKYWWYFLKYIKKRLKEDSGIFTCEEDLHEEFKKRFLTQIRVSPITWEEYKTLMSSADLNKMDFGKYMKIINEWLIENMGWDVPLDKVNTEDELLQWEQELI